MDQTTTIPPQSSNIRVNATSAVYVSHFRCCRVYRDVVRKFTMLTPAVVASWSTRWSTYFYEIAGICMLKILTRTNMPPKVPLVNDGSGPPQNYFCCCFDSRLLIPLIEHNERHRLPVRPEGRISARRGNRSTNTLSDFCRTQRRQNQHRPKTRKKCYQNTKKKPSHCWVAVNGRHHVRL